MGRRALSSDVRSSRRIGRVRRRGDWNFFEVGIRFLQAVGDLAVECNLLLQERLEVDRHVVHL